MSDSTGFAVRSFVLCSLSHQLSENSSVLFCFLEVTGVSHAYVSPCCPCSPSHPVPPMAAPMAPCAPDGSPLDHAVCHRGRRRLPSQRLFTFPRCDPSRPAFLCVHLGRFLLCLWSASWKTLLSAFVCMKHVYSEGCPCAGGASRGAHWSPCLSPPVQGTLHLPVTVFKALTSPLPAGKDCVCPCYCRSVSFVCPGAVWGTVPSGLGTAPSSLFPLGSSVVTASRPTLGLAVSVLCFSSPLSISVCFPRTCICEFP